MVIQTTTALTFNLYQYLFGVIKNWYTEASALLLASFTVQAGIPTTCPDWCNFDANLLAAIASGKATIITAPTGCASLSAGATSTSVELPIVEGAQNVVIMNTLTDSDNQSDVFVLLGDSGVQVTPLTGINIPAGSSIMIPLNGNSYIAAIGASVPNNVCQIAVV